jgi:hypothetical protein
MVEPQAKIPHAAPTIESPRPNATPMFAHTFGSMLVSTSFQSALWFVALSRLGLQPFSAVVHGSCACTIIATAARTTEPIVAILHPDLVARAGQRIFGNLGEKKKKKKKK